MLSYKTAFILFKTIRGLLGQLFSLCFKVAFYSKRVFFIEK